MASDHLPDDLLSKILKSLPVKTLIKLQCVCKLWKSLISSRFFTDEHFKSTTKTAGAPTYLRQLRQWGKHKVSYVLHEQDNTIKNVGFPLLERQHFVTCFQVIHGVVCLTYALDDGRLFNSKIMSFWNPTVRRHVSTPTPFESACNFSGFGFDSSKNDFKAVWSPIGSIYCEVFSARDGKWMKMKQPKCVDSLTFGSYSCFMNGRIHWVTYKFESSYLLPYTLFEFRSRRRRPHGLLLFECEGEEFTTIEFPKLVGDIHGVDPKVFEYRGLLSVLIFGWRGVSMVCELWTMNDSTWTNTQIVDYGVSTNVSCDYKQIDVHMLGRSAYVFEESMLLMDIEKDDR